MLSGAGSRCPSGVNTATVALGRMPPSWHHGGQYPHGSPCTQICTSHSSVCTRAGCRGRLGAREGGSRLFDGRSRSFRGRLVVSPTPSSGYRQRQRRLARGWGQCAFDSWRRTWWRTCPEGSCSQCPGRPSRARPRWGRTGRSSEGSWLDSGGSYFLICQVSYISYLTLRAVGSARNQTAITSHKTVTDSIDSLTRHYSHECTH